MIINACKGDYKKTNEIKNNVLKTGSGPVERTTVSSFSLQQSITTTHINGIWMTYTSMFKFHLEFCLVNFLKMRSYSSVQKQILNHTQTVLIIEDNLRYILYTISIVNTNGVWYHLLIKKTWGLHDSGPWAESCHTNAALAVTRTFKFSVLIRKTAKI